MSLDFIPFNNAIGPLEKSLTYAHSPAAGWIEQLRNSVIQCFEVTDERSRQMLKRQLEATEASPADLDLGTFQSLIRPANERGLRESDWHTWWRTCRQARTDSSGTFDAAKAEAMFAIAPRFLNEAKTFAADCDGSGQELIA